MDDPRNWLFKEYIRVLHEVNPSMFVMENVQGMRTLAEGKLYEFIKKELEAAGYKIKDDVLNAVDYGVPQHRRRNFIVGVRDDLKIKYRFPGSLGLPSVTGSFPHGWRCFAQPTYSGGLCEP
jgi:DNA (cytosine-5)-methyltransferase 1